MSDNGRQFDFWEFRQFAEKLDIEYITSSSRYPQRNGCAENALKTVKKLFKKAREVGHTEYQALLYWRNTPTEGIGFSPALRLFGRRCHTLMPTTQQLLKPTAQQLLKPRYTTKEEKMKEKQKQCYSQHVKNLQPLQRGDTVHMQLPGDKTWSKGVCEGVVGERSYRMKVGDTSYRWNRHHLRGTMETQAPPDIGVSDPVCDDEDECTITSPVINTTVMAEHNLKSQM